MKIFIERIDKTLRDFNLEKDSNLRKYSLNIVNYVFEIKHLEQQEFIFPFLFKVSKATEHDLECFSDSVYLLVNEKVNFFNQKFHYYNEYYDDWEEYSSDKFSKAMISNVFIHPISGEEINQKVYFDIIQPYFIASKELLEEQNGLQ